MDSRTVSLARIVADSDHRFRMASEVAMQLDKHWKKGSAKKGKLVDVVDFFSGCGGMSAGFLAANSISPSYRVVLAADIDEDANATYAKNIGVVPQRLDVRELAEDPERLSQVIADARQGATGPLVLIGCAPCQGFSSHRNSSGQGDLRNSLFVAFAKIAAHVQPDAIVMENVPELLSDRYWPIVTEARRILDEAGYSLRIAVHDMSEFGVPQQRYRALFIAMRRPFEMPKGFLSRKQARTVRDAIGRLSPLVPGKASDQDPMHVVTGHRASTIETIMAVPLDGGSRPADVGPDCLRRAAVKQGRAAYEDVYGRLWWDRPAITITAYARNPASGRYVHPEQHRGLSVREAALLQGFPSNYIFEGGHDSKFRQIGNAVPPAFSAFLAVHLLGELYRTSEDVVGHQPDVVQSVGPSFSRLIPALKAGHRKMTDNVVSWRTD